jgi:IMP cyclohydrolase
MKPAVLLFLALATTTLAAQTPRSNVARPAYPYEVLDAVPEGIEEADREIVSDFLSGKREARSGFESEVQKLCPQYMEDDLTTAEVALSLDEEAKWMDRTIAAAYEAMTRRLSPDSKAALAIEVQRADKTVTVTRMVDLEAAAPEALDRIFRHMCGAT